MRIPPDATIPEPKVTGYLVVFRRKNDKSGYLAQAGFTRDNPEELHAAIRKLAATEDASVDIINEFGEFLRVDGELQGPNGRKLPVTTIWLRGLDDKVQFVTLKPRRERKDESSSL